MTHEFVTQATTLPQAFADATLAIFALTVGPAAGRAGDVREVRAHGGTVETLFAHWIGECCYLQEIEGFRCRAIDFVVFDVELKTGGEPMRLHALLRGEIDAEGAQPVGRVTTVSPRDIAIGRALEGYEVRFTLEI